MLIFVKTLSGTISLFVLSYFVVKKGVTRYDKSSQIVIYLDTPN